MKTIGSFSILVIIGIALLSTFLLFLTILLYFTCWKKRVSVVVSDEQRPPQKPATPAKPCAQPIPFSDIDGATDGFNPRWVLGKGSLGTTYTGITTGGQVFAIKRIYPHLVLINAGGSRFSSTVKSLSLLQHPNLVGIVGYSEAPGERIIVSELTGRKRLDDFFLPNSDVVLGWASRVRIAAGVARAIEYLHEGTKPYVVHGRIKSSNVIIDDHNDFFPRVCDYGLNFLTQNHHYHQQHQGYEELIKASDVYLFGVVLLELLSGRSMGEEKGGFVDRALELIRASRITEVLDPRVEKQHEMKSLMRLAKVASTCVGNSSHCRPSIVQVAAILNSLEMEMEMEMSLDMMCGSKRQSSMFTRLG